MGGQFEKLGKEEINEAQKITYAIGGYGSGCLAGHSISGAGHQIDFNGPESDNIRYAKKVVLTFLWMTPNLDS